MVLLNRVPTSTQLHPPPSSTFQPPPSSIHLHPAPLLFGKKLGQKRRGCLLYLRIGTHVISRLLIVFWISKPKSIFGQIWTEKIKVVQFGWKLTYRLSRRCWFLFQDYYSQCQTLNPFSAKIKVVHFDWKLADSYWDNTFPNCQP